MNGWTTREYRSCSRQIVEPSRSGSGATTMALACDDQSGERAASPVLRSPRVRLPRAGEEESTRRRPWTTFVGARARRPPTMSDATAIRTDTADGVRTITLARPEAYNTITAQLARELSAAIDEAE